MVDQANAGTNLQNDPYRADIVLMPLVRLHAEFELSWAQREEVSGAITAILRHYGNLQKAEQKHEGMALGHGYSSSEIAAMLQSQRASKITPIPHA